MFKILYIDDTENNRILVHDAWEQKRYQALSADNAEQGLALASAKCPIFILMTWGMPGTDG